MEAREIRSYEYVNRPFDHVQRILAGDPVGFFQRATNAAAGRADALVAKLKVGVAGFEIGKDVEIEIDAVDTDAHAPGTISEPATTIVLRWHAARNESLFPSMRAELRIYPLSSDETQLDLHGTYAPPGGGVGVAADALVGHRIAEASLHRFLEDVVDRMRAEAA